MSLSLTVGALVVESDPTDDGYWIESLTRAGKRWSRVSASSPFLHGSVLTHATLETSELVAVIYAAGSTLSALEANKAALEDEFFEFAYTVAVNEGGQVAEYDADCADVAWNDHDAGMSSACIARAVVTIPVYPVPTLSEES